MGKRQKYIIWVGALLLLAMLTCIYFAVDMIYSDTSPNIPDEYQSRVLHT